MFYCKRFHDKLKLNNKHRQTNYYFITHTKYKVRFFHNFLLHKGRRELEYTLFVRQRELYSYFLQTRSQQLNNYI